VAFSTVFGRTAVDSSSLSIAQLAAHTHNITVQKNASTATGDLVRGGMNDTDDTAVGGALSTGSGSTHTHGLDLRVQYVDVIICEKN
jgi:hypothetical protein